MSKNNANVRKSSLLRDVLSAVLLTAALAGSTAASTATDGSTPLALTPGAPAGSYPLSGLDNINLYNGGLNFRLPLLAVGGRGGARQSIGRMIEQHWRMDHYVLPDQTEIHTPMYNPWTPLDLGYSPGVLYGRQVNEGGCAQGSWVEGTLTRLTFVSADGTEFELRDKLTGGAVRTSYCSGGGGPFARGTVFVTADGTSATFVSDTTIYDFVGGSGSSHMYPTGYLMLRDGTRYRVVSGRVSWMRDRNGNQLSYTYPSGGMVVTDSLGRQVTVTPNVSDAQPYGLCDHITFSGFGGAQRTIRVSKTTLGNALRSGYSLQTTAALFGYGSGSTQHNPQVISAVWLPDGKSYQFRYNSYGELARVELPTGGAFEYDYAAGLSSDPSGGVFYTAIFSKPEIYRRVTEKRIYKEGGVLEGKMTVSCTDSQYTNDTTVTVDQRDPAGTLLSRSKHYFYGNPTKSFDVGSMEYPQWRHGREYRTESFDANGTTVLRRMENTWQQPTAGGNWPLTQPETSDFAKPNNPQVTETRTILVDTNQVSKSTFAYDQYNNRTDIYEYDFGAGAPPTYAVRRSQTVFLTTNPVNGLDYASPNPNPSSIHLRSLPQHQRVYSVNPSTGAQTQVSHTETLYDQTSLTPWYGAVTQWADPGSGRGNATKVRRWLDQSGTYIETRAEYDQVGNVSKAVDALNREALIQFSSTYVYSLPTQFTSPVPDPTGVHGSNSALVTTRAYDFSTGLVTSSTDPNNKVVTLEYNDPLDRLTKVNRPDGGWTTYAYATNQYGDYIQTVTLLNASGAQLTQSQYFDGLGRPNRSFKYENYDTVRPWLTTDKQYDALGRLWRESHTYRSTGANEAVNPSGRWTETVYDALGQVKTVTTRPDNAVMTTTYSGNQTTVTDQVGRSRRSVTDGLGRLTQVVEDPNGLAYATTYQYDALGNLRKVDQGGQLRFIMYDSLGRLLRVKHPEQAANPNLALTDPVTGNTQWSMSYAYDSNGNVTARTDARGVTATFWYDNLNRNTVADYSDTPVYQEIRRHYDGAVNGRGRFWADYHYRENWARAEHAAVDSYDAVGRPLNRRQHFYENTSWQWGPGYNTQYAYDRAGNVTSMTYPSGRAVNYAYDVAGRLSTFTGNLGDSVSRNYSTGIIYDEMGGPRQEQYGTDTPVYNKHFYNTRGQLSEIRVSTYSVTTPGQETNWNRGALINRYSNQSWAGSGTDNNGNLLMQMNYIPNDDQISGYQMKALAYSYDQLNRLDKVEELADGQFFMWRQDYDYDRWGNRTINAANTTDGLPEPQFTVNTSTNRLGVPAGYTGTMSFDAAGNLTTDTYTGQGTRAFDAENRMTSAQDAYGQTSAYAYDADGHRTRRSVAGGPEVWQVYGLGGELLAEYGTNSQPSTPQKEYGYRGGELLVQAAAASSAATKLTPTGATASNSYGAGSDPPKAIDGNMSTSWSSGQFPVQWIQLDLGQAYNLTRVRLNVDQYPAGSTVHQLWGGPSPGSLSLIGTSSQNTQNNQWVEFIGSAQNVRYLKVQTTTSPSWVGWREIEVYGNNPASSTAELRWMVNDQLGTPRMVIDKTGSLSSLKRHDYLPFGEEIYAGTGGRTWQQGYTGDNVRQKFTGYERDPETGLDFAEARYFSSAQGRFTSVDPLAASGMTADPQTWNRYTYGLNNPLRYTDPTGMYADGLDAIPNQPDPPPQQQQQQQQAQQPPTPTPSPAAPAPAQPQTPTGVNVNAPKPNTMVNIPMGNGQFFTGVGSVVELTPTDQNGNPIPNVVVMESVTPQTTVQNPNAVTYPNGVVPDLVARGAATSSPVTLQQAGNIIVPILATPTTVTQTHTMVIMSPSSGVVAVATHQRTLSNVDAQGNLRPYVNPQTGRTMNNFTLTMSPVKVTQMPLVMSPRIVF